MPPEYPIAGLLLSGIGAMFALYQRGVAREMAARDKEIEWMRGQLEAWSDIARKSVTTNERLAGTK